MASSFQTRSRIRKLIYTALIVLLFSVNALFLRPHVLETQANALALREQNQGRVDVTGELLRLSLKGSRGLTLCVLWNLANEKQKKFEWNELEMYARTITQLEPHVISPWHFLSWNLAYNVSAESDRVKDKYYFISRGIELMAEGERRNRNHPDFRFQMGYLYQDKIGIADQYRTLRSLFEMSCIDPGERDPRRFRLPNKKIDLVEFQKFCEAYPRLVRRLREQLDKQTPDDVVDFLAANFDIPSRYELVPNSPPEQPKYRLKAPDKQFPVLPSSEEVLNPSDYEFRAETAVGNDFDNHTAARLWFTFAQEPLPPGKPVPGPGVTPYDASKYRIPRRPAIMIFRGYPALAQSHLNERLQMEGWYDDQGWTVDDGYQPSRHWFPGKRVVIGTDRNWSREAWEKAYDLWEKHGRRGGLLLPDEKLDELSQRARKYREAFGVGPNELDAKLLPPDFTGDMRNSFEAHYQLVWYERNRSLTRFPYFFSQAEAEKTDGAIKARKLFYEARRGTRKFGKLPAEVLPLYEQAIPLWKALLLASPEYRKDVDVQEFTYRIQTRYLELLLENHGRDFKVLLAMQDWLAQKKLPPELILFTDLADGIGRGNSAMSFREPLRYLLMKGQLVGRPKGPFDMVVDGQPLITPHAIQRARTRPDIEE